MGGGVCGNEPLRKSRRLEVKGCDCFYIRGTETTGVSGHKSWLHAGGANSDGVRLKACRR